MVAAVVEEKSPTQRLLSAMQCFWSGQLPAARQLAQALMGESEIRPQVLHLLALIAYQAGELEASLGYFNRAIAANPKNARIHYDRGNSLQDMGQLDGAIASYRRALRLRPDFPEAHNDLGTAYYQKGWIEDAISSYQASLHLNPGHGIAHANLATAYRKQGRYDRARQHVLGELKCRLSDWSGGLKRTWKERVVAQRGRALAAQLGRYALACFDAGDSGFAEAVSRETLRRDPLQSDALLALLRALERKGALQEAERIAGEAASARPDDPDFLFRHANVLVRLERSEQAEAAYRKALSLKPAFPKALNNLGSLLLGRNELDAAIGLYRKAAGIDHRYAEPWTNLGLALLRKNELDEAERALLGALERSPDDVNALDYLGAISRKLDKLVQGQQCYLRLSKLRPDDPVPRQMLGLVYRQLGNFNEAEKAWREALHIAPDFWQAHNDLGVLYTDVAKTEKALHHLKAGLKLNPDSVDLRLNLGRLYEFEERLEEAEKYFTEAAALDPGRPLVLNSLAMLRYRKGHASEAIDYCRKAIAADPEFVQAQINLCHLMLEQGNLAVAWPLYEKRYRVPEYRITHSQIDLPRCEAPPSGERSILVYQEQGIGDELMYASCLPDLLERVKDCSVFCSPKLELIFRRSFPGAKVYGCEVTEVPEQFAALEPKPDCKLAIGSLPMFYRQSLADFPRHRGYLRADPEKVQRWRERLQAMGPGRKVGLSWKGGIHITGEVRRTLRLEQLLPILKIEGMQCVSLQYTDCQKDIARLKSEHDIVLPHWQEAIDDYDETAALVTALDMVISVCTAVVHLGGALGKPVWVMAPHSPGWRYAMQSGGMPWYPSVRVFRQAKAGEWDPVLSAILSEIGQIEAPAEGYN